MSTKKGESPDNKILINALNKINKRYQGYAGDIAGKALFDYREYVTKWEQHMEVTIPIKNDTRSDFETMPRPVSERNYHICAWYVERYESIRKALMPLRDAANAPLSVGIKNGQLYITIGINILAFATIDGNENYDFEKYKVSDKDIFAQEMVKELQAETEDGTTAVHLMFDKTADEALNDGCEGIEEKPVIEATITGLQFHPEKEGK